MFARLALESDEEDIVELARGHHKESGKLQPLDEFRVRRTIYRYLDSATPTIFVVEHNRTIIGMLTASIYDYASIDGHFAKEEIIYITPEKRGTRAAALLVDIFVQWADRIGAAESYIQLSDNEKIEQHLKFMGRFGFQRYGVLLRRVKRG